MKFPASPKNLTPEEERAIREHWQWAGRYAMVWIIGTILIFGGVLAMLEFAGADQALRVESLVLLTAVTAQPLLAQAVWKGALCAPLLVRLRFRDHGAPI
jgi:hypothetical protein